MTMIYQWYTHLVGCCAKNWKTKKIILFCILGRGVDPNVRVLWSSDSDSTLTYDNPAYTKYPKFDELSTITQESIKPVVLTDEEVTIDDEVTDDEEVTDEEEVTVTDEEALANTITLEIIEQGKTWDDRKLLKQSLSKRRESSFP